VSDRPILIVDGLNFFMRHYVANPSMSDHGHHVGGMVGFLKGLWYLCERVFPSRVIVVWEGGGSPRRRAILKNYKHNRRPPKLNRFYDEDIPDSPGNRDSQISKIIEVLRNVPVTQIYVPDCEADDLIAYLVKYMLSDQRCVIASSDKDLYQLLSKKVVQWSPGQKKYVTMKTLIEKFSISATNFCTARSFVGDPSDKIDGVPRVGLTSLAKRFPELKDGKFISVDELSELAADKSETKKLKLFENMLQHKDTAKRNWKLMYLDTTNLSADQVRKLEYLIEDLPKFGNKLSLARLVLHEGISNFNIDAFFASINACRVNT